MLTIQGYAPAAKNEPLRLTRFERAEIGVNDVVVKVSHCGLCHSDVDIIDDRFGQGGFPMVTGHEVVGHVERCGAGVAGIREGDRVGIGPLHSSCGHCGECWSARDHYCPKKTVTASPGGLGGFADRLVVSGRSPVCIPDAISSAEAAPLLCAGLTTFAALRRLGGVGKHVAILGVGGLGHVAVQFASKMGMRVTTLSIGLTYEERARHRALGADACVDIGSEDDMKALTGSFDLILSTIYGDVDWFGYVSLLRAEGQLCVIGGSLAPLAFPAGLLIPGARAIVGSAAGSSGDMVAMLRFAAEFDVRPQIELAPMAEINEAIRRLKAGDVRYRMVLEAA